jgi:hypothetical protein
MGRYKTTTPIGRSAQGWPIFIYVEDDGAERYVVAKPTGEAIYSNRAGVPVAPADAGVMAEPSPNAGNFLGAAIGGLLGAVFGPLGAAAGAGIGAWIGGEISKDQEAKSAGAKHG